MLDPKLSQKIERYPLPKELVQQITTGFKNISVEQIEVLNYSMKKQGIVVIDGGFKTGKTSLAIAVVKALLMVAS